jgi:hypothetical protein
VVGTGKAQRSSLNLLGMERKVFLQPIGGETPPEEKAAGILPRQLQPFGAISPGPGPRKKGNGSVTADGCSMAKAVQGLGTPQPGILQHTVGIHQRRSQPEMPGVHLLNLPVCGQRGWNGLPSQQLPAVDPGIPPGGRLSGPLKHLHLTQKERSGSHL